MAQSPINHGSIDSSVDTDPNALLADEDMLKLARERWVAARNWRSGKEVQWKRWYKLYRSYAERKNWPHAVSLFIPLVWSTVESFLPRLVMQKPVVLVEARGDDNAEAASYHRQLLVYQWQDLNLPMVIQDWVKETLIYGTGIIKVGWEKRTMHRRFKMIDPQTGMSVEGDEPDFVVADQPFVALVPLENFYPEPGAPDPERARYVCERYKKTYWELKDMGEGLGWDMKAIETLKDIQEGSQDAHGEDNFVSEKEGTFGSNDSKMAKQDAEIWEFEVIEYWEDSRYCVFVTEPETILHNAYNPNWHGKKPYLRIVDNSLPGEFFGVGESEVLQHIVTELNALHNLRLENVNRSVFQMFKVRIGSPVTPNMTKFKPQGIVWVTQQDDIEPLYSGQPNMALSREEDGLRTWAQIATGANDNFQGLGDGSPETATGASILAQAAASRVGMKFLQLSSMGLEPLGQMLISLNEQYLSTDVAFKVVGPEAEQHVKITPQDLATNGALMKVRLDIGATDPINREMKLQKTMNFLQILMNLYGDPNHPVIQTLIARITDLGDLQIDPELLAVQPNPENVEASGGQPGSSENPEDGPNIRDVLGTSEGG